MWYRPTWYCIALEDINRLKNTSYGRPLAKWSRCMPHNRLRPDSVLCSSPVHDDLCCMSLPFALSLFPVYLHLILSIKAETPKTDLYKKRYILFYN